MLEKMEEYMKIANDAIRKEIDGEDQDGEDSESVDFEDAEVRRIRDVLLESNRKLGEQGAFDMELYEQMLAYVEEYRKANGTAAATN